MWLSSSIRTKPWIYHLPSKHTYTGYWLLALKLMYLMLSTGRNINRYLNVWWLTDTPRVTSALGEKIEGKHCISIQWIGLSKLLALSLPLYAISNLILFGWSFKNILYGARLPVMPSKSEWKLFWPIQNQSKKEIKFWENTLT